MKVVLFSDGGARGNPGPAAVGVVCLSDSKLIFEFGKYLGETTNNVAEYTAVILGLDELLKTKESLEEITWKLDSKLVVEQLARRWKIKEPHLQELAKQCWDRLKQLSVPCQFQHIPREENVRADALVNTTLDAA
ncbi:MAG: ribonuclease HI family protein [bacterium]|nr:ribonuclease HI family protein [bacterium]